MQQDLIQAIRSCEQQTRICEYVDLKFITFKIFDLLKIVNCYAVNFLKKCNGLHSGEIAEEALAK